MAIELDDDNGDEDVLHALFALELEVDYCEDDDDVSRILFYTNFFVTFLSWIYWLGTHAFNAPGHMGALL